MERVSKMQHLPKTALLLAAVWLLTACNDKSIVTVYDQSVMRSPVTCLRLLVVPDDVVIRETLESLYAFQKECQQRLEVSYRSQIVCNSAYNAPQKALSNFPTGYLNMEIRKGLKLQYSYYIDLDRKPDASDVKKGFAQIKKDLKLSL